MPPTPLTGVQIKTVIKYVDDKDGKETNILVSGLNTEIPIILKIFVPIPQW